MDTSIHDTEWILEENRRLREENEILRKTVEQMNRTVNRLLNRFVAGESEDSLING